MSNKSAMKDAILANCRDGRLTVKQLRETCLSIATASATPESSKMFALALDSLLEKGKIKLEGDVVVAVDKDTKSEKKKRKDSDDYRQDESKVNGNDNKEEDNDGANDKDKKRKKQKHDDYEDDEIECMHQWNKGDKTSAPRVSSSSSSSSSSTSASGDCDTTILLFYAYCIPQMTRSEQDAAISNCYSFLSEHGCTGRLRIGREGFNATLTGPSDGIRAFTKFLREFKPETFGTTDFKYVDNLPITQRLKNLKVFPVTEIVTYGFDPSDAPLDMRGTHLTPQEFHEALASKNSIVIDVRNFNETLIGKFAPPGDENKVLDPCMRRSTEFPQWVDDNRDKLEGKQVLMYCTAGVRCERASAFMRNKGIQNVFQLEGGIHRYLEAFPEDGGYWIGKNYTFDKVRNTEELD